jgi:hypothetical protein
MRGLNKYRGIAWLTLIVVVIPLVVYRYAVSGTVEQLHLTRKYRRQIEQLRSTQHQSAELLSVETTDTEMILSGLMVAELLPFIESERLNIENYTPYVTSDKDGIVLTTGQLSVEGAFTSIVKLLWQIEQQMPWCKIISVQYDSVKPRNRGSTKKLICTIYIQQIMTD